MLRHRLLLGPIVIAALIGVLWLDEWIDRQPMPEWVFRFFPTAPTTLPPTVALLALGLLIVSIASRELGAVFHASGVPASRRWMFIAAIAGLMVAAATPSRLSSMHSVAIVSTAGCVVLIGSMLWHIRDRNLRGATSAAGASMFAFVYLGLLFGFLLALRREHSAWFILCVVAITKSCDTGAYFAGRAFGRTKLIKWISPGKTWEGLLGGMATAAAVSLLCVYLSRVLGGPDETFAKVPWWAALGAGVTFALAGQAGDLLASVLKRDAGLKDSGRIPGFGGVLDMIDSVLLVAPVAYWTLGKL